MPINDYMVTATLGANLLVAIIGLYMIFRKVAQTHMIVNSRMDEFKELLMRTAVLKVNEGIAAGVAQGIQTGNYPDPLAVVPAIMPPQVAAPEATPVLPSAEGNKPVTATITIKETR